MQPSEKARTVHRLVRTQDPDRYAAALFIPAPHRATALSLFALNIELTRIPELVSEPALGDIRLQWWHDALAKVALGEHTGHPVADSFAGRIGKDLPLDKLQGLVEATRFALDREMAPDWQALDSYCRATTGALFALVGGLLGPRDEALERASGSAGLAYGLTALLRALPHHLAVGKRFLPLTGPLGPQHDAPRNEAAQAERASIRATAKQHLEQAKSAVRGFPRRQQTAFLPLALVAPYLTLLAETAPDQLRRTVRLNPLSRLWALLVWKP